jgi:hypothetical protein
MSAIELKKKSEQVGIVLTKKKIDKICVQVGLALDVSGSTKQMYSSGLIQATVERLLPIAMRFDDNGILDGWIFDEEATELEPITVDVHENYVTKHILTETNLDGGTRYAPVIQAFLDHYYGPATAAGKVKSFFKNMFSTEAKSTDPVFGLIVTDGENDDVYNTARLIEEHLDKNVYWLFIGAGSKSFVNCKTLAERFRNVSLIKIRDLEKTSDEELYEMIISDHFVTWLKSQQSA